MPLLVAPVFNTLTDSPITLEIGDGYHLVSGNEKLFQMASRYLRKEMNENRIYFDKKVTVDSLFLLADYPQMKLSDDRSFIEEIENKLNLATENSVCSIPYVITADPPQYGINYLKRSLDGNMLHFDEKTMRIFSHLLQQPRSLPMLAYRRYMLSLEKESMEDQLLDLWIALESLFVPDGKKGEITYKLRLRIAYYFAETHEERKKISEFIKTSYNHRSEIVHSGKGFVEEELRDEVKLLRSMARAALINLFMEGISLQQAKGRLDELILAGQNYCQKYAPAYFERVVLK